MAMISSEGFGRGRSILLGLTGLSCLFYAVLAVIQNRPDPFWWFVPGALGALAAVLTWVLAAFAGRANARMASDELYEMVTHRAQRHGFWIAIALYPLAALGVIFLGLGWDTVFAAMGTSTAAAYLLLLPLYEWRMS